MVMNNYNSIMCGTCSRKMMNWSVKWKLQIVLTKCDLLERNDLARTLQQIRNQNYHQRDNCHLVCHHVSSFSNPYVRS